MNHRSSNLSLMSPKMLFLFSRLFPLPFILAGAIALYFGLQSLIRSGQSTEWPTAKGIVKLSKVDYSRSKDGPGTYKANVQYDFIVNGTSFHGDEVAYGDFGSSDSSRAHKISNKYPEGKEVTVYYLPEDPYECVLEPGMKAQAWFLAAFGFLFFIVGTAMFVFLPKLMNSARDKVSHALDPEAKV